MNTYRVVPKHLVTATKA